MSRIWRTTFGKICIVLAFVLVISLVAILSRCSGETPPPSESESTGESEEPGTSTGTEPEEVLLATIEGVWYSDHEDVLTFYPDGTYSSVAVEHGVYSLGKNGITMIASSGKPLLMEIVFTNGTCFLRRGEHTYYRTPETAFEATEAPTNSDEMVTLLYQLFMGGEWVDYSGQSRLTATESEYIATWSNEKGKVMTRTVAYSLSDATEEKRDLNKIVYKAKITGTKQDDSYPVAITAPITFTITQDQYFIYSESIPYARNFSRPREIIENPTTEPTEQTEPPASESNTPPEALFDPVTPDMLSGTWTGSKDDTTWEFAFTSDGAYTFSQGEAFQETGTYTLQEYDSGLFHTALILKVGDKEKVLNFYLRSEGRFLIFEKENHPVYTKK